MMERRGEGIGKRNERKRREEKRNGGREGRRKANKEVGGSGGKEGRKRDVCYSLLTLIHLAALEM